MKSYFEEIEMLSICILILACLIAPQDALGTVSITTDIGGSLVKEGSKVVLQCAYSAGAYKQVIWSKHGGQLPIGRHYIRGPDAKILDIRDKDGGIYVCTVALNDGSEISANISLRVQVNGEWATWGEYGECSQTCSTGVKIRTRNCSAPAPKHGGICVGNASEVQQCEMPTPCSPVDGGWTDYNWQPCPVTCGGGAQLGNRTCTNPAPAYNGTVCSGSETESRPCNTNECPAEDVTSGQGGGSDALFSLILLPFLSGSVIIGIFYRENIENMWYNHKGAKATPGAAEIIPRVADTASVQQTTDGSAGLKPNVAENISLQQGVAYIPDSVDVFSVDNSTV